MNPYIRKQIIRNALLTAPLIALLVVTPVYVIRERNQFNFFILWLLVTIVTLVCWLLNTRIWEICRKFQFQPWLSILISPLIIISIGTGIIYIFHGIPVSFQISIYQVTEIRTALIILINFFIYIQLDLIFTKETALKLNTENAALKFANLEAEYKLLKDQINPHFLFNALSISKSLIKSQPEEAEHYIMELSSFLRSSFQHNQKSATLEEELKLCLRYINLQQARFGDALIFQTTIDNASASLRLPFFTLVSLAENVLKHNTFTSRNPIIIEVSSDKDFLLFSNNLQPKPAEQTSGTGLINLNQRCLLLSGHPLEIITTESRFIVSIKLIHP